MDTHTHTHTHTHTLFLFFIKNIPFLLKLCICMALRVSGNMGLRGEGGEVVQAPRELELENFAQQDNHNRCACVCVCVCVCVCLCMCLCVCGCVHVYLALAFRYLGFALSLAPPPVPLSISRPPPPHHRLTSYTLKSLAILSEFDLLHPPYPPPLIYPSSIRLCPLLRRWNLLLLPPLPPPPPRPQPSDRTQ
jgi:hypothetical protein